MWNKKGDCALINKTNNYISTEYTTCDMICYKLFEHKKAVSYPDSERGDRLAALYVCVRFAPIECICTV